MRQLRRNIKKLLKKLVMHLLSWKLAGINSENNRRLRTVNFYTSHEALLLPVEEAMTRVNSTTGEYHNTSALSVDWR